MDRERELERAMDRAVQVEARLGGLHEAGQVRKSERGGGMMAGSGARAGARKREQNERGECLPSGPVVSITSLI